MAASEQKYYPKGRLSLGSGDLIDVTDVGLKASKGRKLVATIRQNPSGFTDGEANNEITFKSALSEDGFERDFWGKWQKGEVVQLRLKVPGKTFVQTGVFDDLEITSNVGGHIEFSAKHIGKLKPA